MAEAWELAQSKRIFFSKLRCVFEFFLDYRASFLYKNDILT
jgi:hypothetical protein